MDFLRENDAKWQTRRKEEVDRIKEEEKKDRLAICKEKKKIYGIKKLNKEENLRLKRREKQSLNQRPTIGSKEEWRTGKIWKNSEKGY